MKYLIILILLAACDYQENGEKRDNKVFNRLDDWLVSCMENDSSPEGITLCQTQYFGMISLCTYKVHPDMNCLKLRLDSKSKEYASERE